MNVKCILHFTIIIIGFIIIIIERAVHQRSEAGVHIDKAQYIYHDTQSDKGIQGTYITAKSMQYADKF